MIRARTFLAGIRQHNRRFYSSRNAFPAVQTTTEPLTLIKIEEFRARAFVPELPLLILARDGSTPHTIPAAENWFVDEPAGNGDITLNRSRSLVLSQQYLSPYSETVLPYELNTSKGKNAMGEPPSNTEQQLSGLLSQLIRDSPNSTFHRFSAPLSLFLQASTTSSPPALYIAQAQISSLPTSLQADLPTPHLVLQAGKGDIYDANIWMGIPPTYTPLHRDPNPNLFVQLASQKRVRLFKPSVGAGIFRDVQTRIGRAGHGGVFRGDEMMEGAEKEALLEAVWGDTVSDRGEEGFEAFVGPGDALFIPKGWWHSFMSVGDGVTASVNWWFR